MKKAFTLAEMLIAMMIAGVIASLTIPTLMKNVQYNNSKILFKSGYRLVETAVSDMVSDISLYPAGQLDSTFCTNFFSKMNTIGTVSCTTSTVAGTPNATTSNAMRWYGFDASIAATQFTSDTTPLSIKVDIDGAGKGTNTAGSDILTIQIFRTGKVTVTGTNEVDYLLN
ncbi:MAG: type II secretion system protein [Candidatus Gastranaerophilales bacterium]|nr:type II secretion system protein [Candidatus Gastranaerophilales bacterium]